MSEQTLQAVDGLLASGDAAGTLDLLIQFFSEKQDFGSLFEARRLKCRLELGLPLVENSTADSSEEIRTAYEKAIVKAARETGELALKHGNIPGAWRFFRAIGEPAPVAEAIEHMQPDDGLDEVIGIALQEGVHPAKGLELILTQHGMCRAITVFGMYPMQKDRAQCIALLVRSLHAEVVERLARTIEAQEGSRPDTASVIELISGRDWLFGEYDYYVDTSHLYSLLPYCLEAHDEATLQLFRELCEYGKRLSPMFKSRGQPPFEEPCVDYGEYVLALLGEGLEERIAHFRRKVQDSDPDLQGTAPAQLLVNLFTRLGRYEDALDVWLAHLSDEDPQLWRARPQWSFARSQKSTIDSETSPGVAVMFLVL